MLRMGLDQTPIRRLRSGDASAPMSSRQDGAACAVQLDDESHPWGERAEDARADVLAREQQGGVGEQTERLLDRIHRRVVPVMFLILFVCHIDRTGLSFAAPQLGEDIGLTKEEYGFGAGIFFIGYAAMQIPSNVLLQRVGARRWLAMILVTWGVLVMLFAFLRSVAAFTSLRFLLGVAEAGAFPGAWYYLTLWFPASRMARPHAQVVASVPIAQVVAAPVAAGLLALDCVAGVRGWQWIFLVEGVPAIVLGAFLYFYLPNGPADSPWLSDAERGLLQWLHQQRGTGDDAGSCAAAAAAGKAETALGGDGEAEGLLPAGSSVLQRCSGGRNSPGAAALLHRARRLVGNARLLHLAAVEFLFQLVAFGCIFWMTFLIHDILSPGSATPASAADPRVRTQGQQCSSAGGAALPPMGSSDQQVHDGLLAQEADLHSLIRSVLLSAVPYSLSAIAMNVGAWHSQRAGERRLHIALPYLVAGLAFLLQPAALSRGPAAAFACLVVAVAASWLGHGPKTSLATQYSTREMRAAQLALFNTIGNTGAFLGPVLLGALPQRSGSAVLLGPAMLLAGALALLLRDVLEDAGEAPAPDMELGH